MQIQVTSAAQRDLIEAQKWYETQSRGLGKDLIIAVDAVISLIQKHSTLPRLVLRDLRRVQTKRFPYAIYYEIREPDIIRVVAIFHTARDQSRLTSRH